VRNLGNSTAASSTVGYYLSTNQTLDASDVLMKSTPGGSLGAGQYAARYEMPVVPPATAPGSYYVLYVADPLNAVSETDETNNVAYQTLLVVAPGIDLLVQQVGLAASTVTPGFAISSFSSIQNAGNIISPNVTVSYYLSVDPLLDAADVLLSTTTGPGVPANSSQGRSASLMIPAGTPAGTHYVLLVVDPQNAIVETNENNNLSAQALTVLGPFAGTIVPFTGTATVTTCATTIYDNGGFNSYANDSEGLLTILPATPGAMVQLVFNAFALESGYDYLRIYDGTSANAPLLGAYTGYQLPFPVQATNAAGALTVEFVSDAAMASAGFEAVVSCGTAPLPDLLLTQIGASPSRVVAGASLSLSAAVANQGAGPAASTPVGYYLSTNQVLDAADRLLGTSAGSALAPNLANTAQLLAAVPGNVPAGAYYVLFVADPLNAVSETNEANNLAALAVTVTQALAGREQTAGYAVAVAPNPVASGHPLRVELSGAGTTCVASIELYNALGQRVRTQPLPLSAGRANQAEVATQHLAPGVYTLRLTGPNLNASRRVVIE
jgi:subtilase family serine protease